MAGQKARIDKDSNDYLTKNARPEAEAETAYDSNNDLEGDKFSADRNGNGDAVFKGSTKKDKTRKADQVTTGTEGDMGSGLEKMETTNPFARVIYSRFFAEAENPGVASAPATSDSPSLGMMAVNNTDFRIPEADVRSVLEQIALQAAEAFEMLDENSNVPDAITNELQNTSKAITKIYEFASKGQSQDGTGETSDAPAVGKDAAVGKPAVNEEAEQIDELSKDTMKSYVRKALDTNSEKSVSNLASKGGYEYGQATDPGSRAGEKEDAKSVVRSKGIMRAVNKLTKEEAVDEALIGKQKKLDKNHNGKLDKQDFKILRKEETEQIDEISQTTAKNYVSKAFKDSNIRGEKLRFQSFGLTDMTDKEHDSAVKKQINRGKGINTALAKLGHTPAGSVRKTGVKVMAKEEKQENGEQIDELSRKTLGAYGSKALRAGLKGDEKSEKRFKGANLASAKLYPSQYEKSPLKAKVPATEEAVDEALIGKQKKLDKNHNGKLDAHDFKLLRAKKTMKEATDIVFKTLLKDRLDADN